MSNKHSKQTKKAPPKTKEKQSAGTIIKNVLIFGLLFSLIAVLAGVCVFLFYAKDAPELDEAKLTDSLSSKFYDSSGNLVEELGEKIRESVTANEIPDTLKNAVISIEDKRFEKHFGIDPIRIVGAAINNTFNKSSGQQGGSTLTQQLIKLSFFSTDSSDATLKRKAQEAWLAMKLERTKSKDEILAYYINKTYMSNGVYGMATAAKVFYGKDSLSELSLAQSALLAGLPQAPTDYDPYVHPDAAKERRDMVLGQMYEDGKISKEEYDTAVATPIDDGLQPIDTSSSQINKIADNYLKEVIEEVQEKTGKNIYTDGLSIYMNIDMDAQTYLYNLVNSDETIQFPDDDFQTAVTMVDVNNGQVKAQIGGRKVADDVQLGENLAVSPNRDVGSTVKPIFDYGPAFEYLYKSTGSIINDSPITYSNSNDSVKNYDNQYLGNITLRYAVTDSRNVPALKTFREVGVDKVTTFINGLGISYDESLTEDNAISGKISTLQLAEAYAAFANGGIYYQPSYISKIVYQDGQEETFEDEGTRAMSEATAYMMTDVLKGVITSGTGKNATIANLYQAGKTGTSNYPEEVLPKVVGDQTGSPDISFAGYTRSYSIAVWTGYYNYYRAIPKADQTIASSIYRNLMTYVSQNVENTNWEKPSTVIQSGSELYVQGHTQNMPSASYTYQSSTPTYYDDDDDETDYYSSSSSSYEQPASSSTSSVVVPDNSTSSSASPTPTPSTSSEEQNNDQDVTPSPPVNNQ